MTDHDDPFEAALRQGLAERGDELEVPEGLGRGGIRRARRRTARKTAIAGVPVLAAAVAVVIVLTSGGTSSRPKVAPPKTIDASDVVRQVNARIAAITPSDGVVERVSTTNKQRPPEAVEYQYTDPKTKVFYDYARYFNKQGAVDYSYWDRDFPLSGGRVKSVAYQVSPLQKSWFRQQKIDHSLTMFESGLTLQSSARSIARSLKKGHVKLGGYSRVRGHRVLEIKEKNPNKNGTQSLYVDATTYQPIELTDTYTYPKKHHLFILDRIFLLPATPANIAKATTGPDLTGYKQTKG